MARKTAAVKSTSTVKQVVTAAKRVASKVASSTPVRNTAIPKVATSAAAPAKREISHQMIAVRAFEIAMGGTGGSELDNWYRAERELRAGL